MGKRELEYIRDRGMNLMLIGEGSGNNEKKRGLRGQKNERRIYLYHLTIFLELDLSEVSHLKSIHIREAPVSHWPPVARRCSRCNQSS